MSKNKNIWAQLTHRTQRPLVLWSRTKKYGLPKCTACVISKNKNIQALLKKCSWMPWRTIMIGWQTTKHGRSGLGLEMGGCYHMQESIFINQKMKNNWWAQGAPQQLATTSMAPRGAILWSDLSWSQADLCANSYVIYTRFSPLSTLPSCTRYISYVGILLIIHNILFRIICLYDNELGPTDFQLTCYCLYFLIFE